MVGKVSVLLIIGGTFGCALFMLLNGPLWLISRLGIFTGGREAPRWLLVTTTRASRTMGIASVLLWLAAVSQGSIMTALLLGVILILGALLLLNAPIWLITHVAFARGPEVSSQVQTGLVWLSHVLGTAAVASVLYLTCQLQLCGLQ